MRPGVALRQAPPWLQHPAIAGPGAGAASKAGRGGTPVYTGSPWPSPP